MTRKEIEKKAFKAFPEIEGNSFDEDLENTFNKYRREGFINGYEQAEKCHTDYIEKRLENLIDKPGEYNRGAREVLAHLLSKLGGSPAKYFIFKRDCTTCKYGKYNDHWDKHFCYNNEECNNFELYEIDENIDSLERGK